MNYPWPRVHTLVTLAVGGVGADVGLRMVCRTVVLAGNDTGKTKQFSLERGNMSRLENGTINDIIPPSHQSSRILRLIRKFV